MIFLNTKHSFLLFRVPITIIQSSPNTSHLITNVNSINNRIIKLQIDYYTTDVLLLLSHKMHNNINDQMQLTNKTDLGG